MKVYTPSSPLHVNRTLTLSSLGLDSATTAAAMRAGLSRPDALYGFPVTTDEGEEVQISGHPITLLTCGFEGVGRYRQLLGTLFEELRESIDGYGEYDAPLYLLVGVPDATRYREGIALASGEPLGEEEDDFDLYGQSWDDVVATALESAGIAGRFAFTRVVETGAVRSTRLLQMAEKALAREPRATVVLVIVDSLSDAAGLQWLSVTGRLKSAVHPVGVSPGEAIGALFLSRKSSEGSMRVESVGYADEAHDLFDDSPPEGRALATLIDAFAAGGECGPLWSIANLSGEQRPFFEWSMASVHRCAHASDATDDPPWLSAMHLGEIGAAFLPVAVAWSMEAQNRGYAPSSRCAIVLTEHGSRRALLAMTGAV